MASLGDRLKQRLKEKKTNAVQLGTALKIPPTVMYNVMQDPNRGMQAENLNKIAVALGVTEDWLLYGTMPKLRRMDEDKEKWLTAVESLTDEQRKAVFDLIASLRGNRR